MFKLTTNFHVTTKTKISFNGQEFESVGQMPPSVRAAYESAMASIKGTKLDGDSRVTTRIVVNGQEYASVEDMPPEARRVYEELLANTESPGSGDADVQGTGQEHSIQAQWTTVETSRHVAGPNARALHVTPAAATQKLRRTSRSRKRWFSAVMGALLLILVLAYGGRFEGKESLSMDSPYALLLVIPAAFFLHAVYASFRRSHCPHCGADLPTEDYPAKGFKCPRCHRQLDLP